jgi:hypothetical protein
MMASLVTVRHNRAGFLEARAQRGSGRRGALLADFLQADVQGDAAVARDLLARIAAARRGAPPQREAVGNAFAMRIAPAGVSLRNAILARSRPADYTLDEFAAALAAWLAAIETAAAQRLEPPPPNCA